MAVLRRYMTPIPFTVEKDTSVRAALELMRRHGVRHLPVEHEGKVVGILSDWDIISASSMERSLDQKVEDLMTVNPCKVSPETDVFDAMAAMVENGIGSTLVMNEGGEVIGIFTEKDAVRVMVELDGPGHLPTQVLQ